MIELGTPTCKGVTNDRPRTIELVIVSKAIQVSIVEIVSDHYMGTDHKRLWWEMNNRGIRNR
jgi:hypothetical protein